MTTNPVVISFGVTCAWGRATSVTAAFTDHPVLGWSKGLGLNWAKNTNGSRNIKDQSRIFFAPRRFMKSTLKG
jgi:hypothetical protein